MPHERYNYSNKEKVFEAISEPGFDDSKHFNIYQTEIAAITNHETYADLLALAPWNKMSSLTRIVLGLLDGVNLNKSNTGNPDQFYSDVTEKIHDWGQEIDFSLNRIGTSHTLRKFLSNSRNLISLIQGRYDLQRVCDMLVLCDNAGVVPQEADNQIFLQYPGSFNPFPHLGHVELSTIVRKCITSDRSIIVVTTFDKNKYRNDAHTFSFSTKIDLLNRGFAFEPRVVVAGIAGNSERQAQQMQLFASLGGLDKSIHYILGNDAFIDKVRQAKSQEDGVLKLFDRNTTFYVSKRNGYASNSLYESCVYAKSMGCTIVFLPNQQSNTSGTETRQKLNSGSHGKEVYPNKYVEDFFNKNYYLPLS